MAITGIKLRCALSQTVSDEHTVDVSAGLTSGDMILHGSVPAIVVKDGAFGDVVAVITEAEKVLVPCATATTGDYAEGSLVYFDEADEEVNQASTGNHKCGYVLTAASVGDTEVLIRFDGSLAL